MKNSTTLVAFFNSSIEYLPKDQIKKEFPNLIYLEVLRSHVPSKLTPDFLTDFHELKGLTIAYTEMKYIQENAFSRLVDLEFLDLGGNKISKISRNIFSRNSKLKVINLSNNKMKLLSPKIFDNLKLLDHFYFTNNKCASENFVALEGDLSSVKEKLKPCFENFQEVCMEQTKCLRNLGEPDQHLTQSLKEELSELKKQLESQREEIEDLKESQRNYLNQETEKMQEFREEMFDLKNSFLTKGVGELKFRSQVVENTRDLLKKGKSDKKTEKKLKLLTLKVLKIKAILAGVIIKLHKLKTLVWDLISVVFLIIVMVA
jgi:Leucine-rich repeat (LRR) protein